MVKEEDDDKEEARGQADDDAEPRKKRSTTCNTASHPRTAHRPGGVRCPSAHTPCRLPLLTHLPGTSWRHQHRPAPMLL